MFLRDLYRSLGLRLGLLGLFGSFGLLGSFDLLGSFGLPGFTGVLGVFGTGTETTGTLESLSLLSFGGVSVGPGPIGTRIVDDEEGTSSPPTTAFGVVTGISNAGQTPANR
jgi:hypothetical protein